MQIVWTNKVTSFVFEQWSFYQGSVSYLEYRDSGTLRGLKVQDSRDPPGQDSDICVFKLLDYIFLQQVLLNSGLKFEKFLLCSKMYYLKIVNNFTN